MTASLISLWYSIKKDRPIALLKRKPSPLCFSSWKVKQQQQQRQLCDYIRSTWIDSSTWPPSLCSVFKHSVRSNNDVEGWHRRLNQKASRGQLNMYLLLQLLGNETKLLKVQLTFLKESSHTRRQRESSRRVTSRLFADWVRLAAIEQSKAWVYSDSNMRLTRHSSDSMAFQAPVNSSQHGVSAAGQLVIRFWAVTSWLAPRPAMFTYAHRNA